MNDKEQNIKINYKNWLLGIIPSEEIAIKVSKRTGTILIIYSLIMISQYNLSQQAQTEIIPVYYSLILMIIIFLFIICAIIVRVKKNFIAAIICSLIIVLIMIYNASSVGKGEISFIALFLSAFMLFICYSSLMATSFLRK